jgi:SAM-dependent methyltransferase
MRLVTRRDEQRRHYDDLARTRRPTRYGVSCGFHDRFDPALLERRPALRRAMTRLLDAVLPSSIDVLLDVGCGTAYYWPLLAGRCRTLVGLELSPAMAATGRRHRSISGGQPGEVLCSDASRIPLDAGSVDVVLCIDALHHLDGLDGFLAESQRVLRPGGVLVAVEPNVWNPVVFLAHLLPPEERGALWPNHPLALRGALTRAFGRIEVWPVTYVSGIDSSLALKLVDFADAALRVPPLSLVALRRVFIARPGRR